MLPQWVVDHNIGAVVCDFNPLRVPMGWLDGVKGKLRKDVPLIQVTNLHAFFLLELPT